MVLMRERDGAPRTHPREPSKCAERNSRCHRQTVQDAEPKVICVERLGRAQLDLGDFMLVTVAPHAEHPEITNEGMVYQGQRYRVDCALAGKPSGESFGLDVAFADPIFAEPTSW
jgi:hypothetical protein